MVEKGISLADEDLSSEKLGQSQPREIGKPPWA